MIVREPLANGYLSGSYRPGGWVTADDWRSGYDAGEVQRTLELVEELRRTEVPEGDHGPVGPCRVPAAPGRQRRGGRLQVGRAV